MLYSGMDAIRPFPRKAGIKKPNAGASFDTHKSNTPGTQPQKGVTKSSNRYPRKSIQIKK